MLTLNHSIKVQFLLLFLIFGFISCKQNRNSTKEGIKNRSEIKTDSLDLTIKSLMSKHKITGISVALIINGKLSSTRNYGVLQKGTTEK